VVIGNDHRDSARFNALLQHDVTTSAPDLVKTVLRK
jgi:hypothetical protein